MAKTAAERRAARKRKEQHRSRHRTEQTWGRESTVDVVRRLVFAASRTADERELDRIAAELAALDPEVDPRGEVSQLLLTILIGLWGHGWQPADFAHVVRRQTTQRITRLALAVLARTAQVTDAPALAPEEWMAQLAALDLPADPDGSLPVDRMISHWRAAENLPAAEAWRDVVRLVSLLGSLPELQRLGPPPSEWRRAANRRPRAAGTHPTDARMLGRIRALLAKAESTEFPEEAEALTAKAQELMTRYAVDAAVLDAEQGTALAAEVRARRVHVENPYPEAKVRLLDAVGDANGVRVIWMEWLGIATMVGLPVDLDSVDLLFTSLLVQATRAMADTGRVGGRRTRSPSFRRAFLISYAVRIGERLMEARERTTAEESRSRGTDLVPVLRARTQAVDDAFAALFPDVYQKRTRALDAGGWHAGRLAAESADIGSGREQVRG